jgi:putative ABC transport system permease protein
MKLLHKLRTLFRRGKLEAEMTEEMRGHVEMQAELNRRAGMDPEHARCAALRQFGNVSGVQETVRDQRGWLWCEQFGQDLRIALRSLARNSGFASTAIVTLTLGIGATTAIFSVTYAVALRPLPFPEPERLMAVWTSTPQVEKLGMAAANHLDIQQQATSFQDMAIYRGVGNVNLVGDGLPERLSVSRVGANLFPLLGIAPALGRGFFAEECRPGRDRVVVLSHGLWQRRFAGDPGVVGQMINLEGRSHEVVGVMPEDFQFPRSDVQMWQPLTINPADFLTRTGYGHLAVARLKPGVTRAGAQDELEAIAQRLAAEHPANLNVRFTATPLRKDIAGPAEQPLLVLLGAALGLLLIGCGNLANLLLARGLTRGRETAVRSALGATRSRLVRQTAAEMLPIMVVGLVGGIVLARVGVAFFLPWLPANLPRLNEVAVNLPVLAFSAGAFVLAAAVILGLVTAQAARTDLSAAFRSDARVVAGGATKLRNGLVVGQVALSVVLLTGAGLLVRSFVALKEIDPGFRAGGTLSLRLAIPRQKYPSDEKVAAFCRQVLEQVRALPGVEAVGMGNRLPLGEVSGLSTIGVKQSDTTAQLLAATDETTVSPDYFRAMGIRLLEGRTFAESDGYDSLPVVVVDEAVARKAWPGESALGKHVRSGPQQPWAEVIGVAAHVRHESLEEDRRMQIYWNYTQRPRDRMTLIVRTGGDPKQLAKAVAAAVLAVDPEQPVYGVRTMDEIVAQTLALRRFNTVTISVFGGMSLALAVIGLYGVIAWNVRQRTREIGVRIALGAERRGVLRLVLGDGLRLALAGVAIGLLGAAGAAYVMRSLLFGVAPWDPVTFTAIPVMLVVAAIVASWLPARWAARVDPMVALRAE